MIFPFIIKCIPISSIYLPFSRIQSVNFASLFSNFFMFFPGCFSYLKQTQYTRIVKSTLFTRFCGRTWCTGHNGRDPSGSPTYRSALGLLSRGYSTFILVQVCGRAASGGLKNGQAQKQGLKEFSFFFFFLIGS